MNRRDFAALCVLYPVSGLCRGIDVFSNQDAAAALKQALEQGAVAAVSSLGVADGFFGDARFRIPLPNALVRAEPFFRAMGQGHNFDELHLAMNRAAELAVAEAKTLLVTAVKQMTVQDAKGILNGGQESATDYFRSKTAQPLTQKFLPIVSRATARLKLAEQYNRIAAQAAAFGLVSQGDANVQAYVTRHALNALYTRIGEEERAIRANPAEAIGSIARKVFKAIGR